jgi:ABC-type lipoprotein release transport system permease subunit
MKRLLRKILLIILSIAIVITINLAWYLVSVFYLTGFMILFYDQIIRYKKDIIIEKELKEGYENK